MSFYCNDEEIEKITARPNKHVQLETMHKHFDLSNEIKRHILFVRCQIDSSKICSSGVVRRMRRRKRVPCRRVKLNVSEFV